jgi:hypothetical protein
MPKEIEGDRKGGSSEERKVIPGGRNKNDKDG